MCILILTPVFFGDKKVPVRVVSLLRPRMHLFWFSQNLRAAWKSARTPYLRVPLQKYCITLIITITLVVNLTNDLDLWTWPRLCHAQYLGQLSFRLKVIVQNYTHSGLIALSGPLNWSVKCNTVICVCMYVCMHVCTVCMQMYTYIVYLCIHTVRDCT